MREDGRIYNDLDEFAFLGYTIREKDYPFLKDQHKPGSSIITIDTMLGPRHPLVDKPVNAKGKRLENNTGELFKYSEIVKNFSNLSDSEKRKYSIYGYAIEHEGIFRYKYPSREWKNDEGYNIYCFLYALYDLVEPNGEFRGFDVAEAEVPFISALCNCGINWKKAEEYGILNTNNLFNDYSSAKIFCKYADEVVEEHSPFSVWGIWEVIL